jgi:integral membrane protein (TIGR01906 family)
VTATPATSAASRPSSVAVATLAAGLVAVATSIVILALAIVPFLTPAWVSFEQGRADAAEWTGYAPADLERVTGAILHDLVIGPPEFAVTLDGAAVLTARERAHMRDVRAVFAAFYGLAAVGAVGLALAWLAGRRVAWLAATLVAGVRAGALFLAGALVLGALVVAFAFDAAFEVFHQLFFPVGSYLFDPRTDRLVQLFPEAFWSETAVAVGAVALVLALLTAWIAGRARRAAG